MFNFVNKLNKQNNNINCTAIIAAAGNSSRMQKEINKQFVEIIGKPIIAYSMQPFQDCTLIDEIIIITKEEYIMHCNKIVEEFNLNKVKKIVVGGDSRQKSVYNGLKEITSQTDIVLVHDGARPLVTIEDIECSILECLEHKAVVVGTKVQETVKIIDQNQYITSTPDRNILWTAHTPQTFDYKLLMDAYNKAFDHGFLSTDDSSLVERLGYKVKIIEGNGENIKVTTEKDLHIVKSILENGQMY